MKSQVSVRSQLSEDTRESRTSSRSSATPPPPPPRARRSSSVQSGSSSGTPMGTHTAPLRLTTTLTEETSPQRVKRRNKPLPQITTPNIQTNIQNIQTNRRIREDKNKT